MTLKAESESWAATATMGVYLDPATHEQGSGCSQATGDAWPMGLVILMVLAAARGRSRLG